MLRFAQDRVPPMDGEFSHLPHFEYGEEEAAAKFLHEYSARHSLVRERDRVGVVYLKGYPSTLIWGSEIIQEVNRFLDEEYNTSALAQLSLTRKVQEARGLEYIEEEEPVEEEPGAPVEGDYVIQHDIGERYNVSMVERRGPGTVRVYKGSAGFLNNAIELVYEHLRNGMDELFEVNTDALFEDLEGIRLFIMQEGEYQELDITWPEVWHPGLDEND